MNTRIPILTIALLAPIAIAQTHPAASWFPLDPQIQWKYRVTTQADDREEKSERTLAVGKTIDLAGKPAVLIGDTAYAAREDGVYAVGSKSGEEIRPLDPPHKLISADPKMGQKWNYREGAGNTAVVVLGPDKITVPAGDFDCMKIYAITAEKSDTRHEITRWFARGIGIVKTIDRVQKPAGEKLLVKETTTELLEHRAPGASQIAGSDADRVAALFSEGEALAKKGDHPGAIAKYDQAIAADPKAAKAHAYRALSLLATKRLTDAEQSIAKALELNPKEFTYHEILGQLRLAEDKLTEGIKQYDTAAELSPRNAGAIYMDLAGVLAARHDQKLAGFVEQALKKSAQSDPPEPNALFALGQMYVSAGRRDGKQYLQRYVTIISQLPAGKRDEQKLTLAKQMIRAIEALD